MVNKKLINVAIISAVLLIVLVLIVPTIFGSVGEGKKKVICTGNADFDIIGGEDLENVNCYVKDSCGILFATAPFSLFGTLIGEDLRVELSSGDKVSSKTFTNVGPLEAPEFKLDICVPTSQRSATLKLYKEDGILGDSKTVSI